MVLLMCAAGLCWFWRGRKLAGTYDIKQLAIDQTAIKYPPYLIFAPRALAQKPRHGGSYKTQTTTDSEPPGIHPAFIKQPFLFCYALSFEDCEGDGEGLEGRERRGEVDSEVVARAVPEFGHLKHRTAQPIALHLRKPQ